ncbi:MAG: diguanylate cyclase (GGDEF)-like protein [Acidimicrobiales bacterium]
MTRRKQYRRKVEDTANERFQALIEESKDFFFVIAPGGEITYRSPSVLMAGGDNPPEHLNDLLDMLSGVSRDIARTVFYDTAKATGVLKVPLETALGSHWIELHLNDQTANPAVQGIIITGREITDEENLTRKLANQALVDELTGLPNRRALNTASEATLARSRRRGKSSALLLIDLDGFKGVNDTLGHPAGDSLLCTVAERLSAATRAGEIVARLGGDEFAIVAEDVAGEEAALALADRALEVLRTPLEIDGQLIAVGGSVGLALSQPGDDLQANDLLKHADIALYQAKRNGRGRSVVFVEHMAQEAEIEARLLREVESGFDHGEFHLAFQPLISTHNTETVAFEALMRWHSPTLGIVPPTTFIPIAERTGAILRMGRWALEESCRRVAEWRNDFPDRNLSVSVNVSIRQIVDQDFPAIIAEVLKKTGVDPPSLQLEVTESLIAQDPYQVAAALELIRSLGVRIALDDFGTGYSSMAQLQTLPVDCIKIDRAFIERLSDDDSHQSASVLQAMIDMARALDVVVVAEGVEDEEQLLALLHQDVELPRDSCSPRLSPPNRSTVSSGRGRR